MIWSAATYQTEYNLTTAASILTPMLQRAEYRVETYITATAFADASAVSPDDLNAASLVKYAIGDLTLFYLRQRNIVAPAAGSYEENYSGVISYKISSGDGGAGQPQITEGSILSTLSALAKESTAELTVAGGTGRFVSGSLVVSDDDDD